MLANKNENGENSIPPDAIQHGNLLSCSHINDESNIYYYHNPIIHFIYISLLIC